MSMTTRTVPAKNLTPGQSFTYRNRTHTVLTTPVLLECRDGRHRVFVTTAVGEVGRDRIPFAPNRKVEIHA